MVAQQVYIKFEKFKEINIEDLKRVISNIINTHCESDAFPICDTKGARNIHLQYYLFENC